MPIALICHNPECGETFFVKPSQAKTKKCCCMACYSQMRKLATDERHIGSKYGKLTILSRYETVKSSEDKWFCQCDCGQEYVTRVSHLMNGGTVSCGCHRRKMGLQRLQINGLGQCKPIQPGTRYGRWTIIDDVGVINGNSRSLCRCDCGTERIVMNKSLDGNSSKSCGCYHKDVSREQAKRLFTTHGMSSDPDYLRHMKHRRSQLDRFWTHEMEYALRKMFPVCVICGSDEQLATDHVKPLSKGNGLEPGNAVVLCKSCNSIKHNRDLSDLPTGWQIAIEQAAMMFVTSIECK